MDGWMANCEVDRLDSALNIDGEWGMVMVQGNDRDSDKKNQ